MSDSPAPRLRLDGLESPLAGPFALALAAGACASITGPSGAGKSLFLRMVADLDVNEGEVALDGKQRERFTPAEWRRRVGYVPAEPGWWSERVRDHIARDRLDEARGLAAKLGLEPEQVDAEVMRLSTGERQRFALVRALLVDPEVLLLDEPTGALDQESVARVEALLREVLGRGTSVLMVTHDAALATRLGAEHYHMADRRLSKA